MGNHEGTHRAIDPVLELAQRARDANLTPLTVDDPKQAALLRFLFGLEDEITHTESPQVTSSPPSSSTVEISTPAANPDPSTVPLPSFDTIYINPDRYFVRSHKPNGKKR